MDEIQDSDVEVFINNAGFGDCGIFYQTDINKDIDMIDVNIRAVHLFTKMMLQKLKSLQWWICFKCCIICRAFSRWPLYGNLLCDKGICYKSYAGAC